MTTKSLPGGPGRALSAGATAAGGRRAVRLSLAALTAVVGVAAVWGGVLLMTDSWQMPADWLSATPFHTWFLPGLALLSLIGGSQLVAAVGLFTNRRWARTAVIWAGLILVGWILVQLVLLRRYHPMQPTMVVLGSVTALLGWWLPRPAAPASG